MKKTKVMSAKRSFFMSVLSLVLCFAMLIGTTWAWFTDSVTSGTNQIKAGNLDIDVLHTSASVSTEASISAQTNLFRDVNGNEMKWEPGAVSYETFKVKNLGSLALKYNMALNITDYNAVSGTNETLKNALKVKVLTGTDILTTVTRENVAALTWTDGVTLDQFTKEGGALYPATDPAVESQPSEETFQVIVYWQPTDDDNKWNVNNTKTTTDGQPLFIEFGINVIASQLQHESDSFGSDYDAGIVLPDLPVSINKTFQSAPITNKLTGTETLEIKNVSTNTGVATMPAAAANAVVSALEEQVTDKKENTDVSTVIYLKVETVEKKSDAVTYNIDLSAIMTYTDTNGEKKTTKLETLDGKMDDKIITAKMNIGKGLSNVTVKHDGTPMAQLSSADNDAEGYFYNNSTGDLTIKSKSFSPFTVDYTIDAEAAIGNTLYGTLQKAADAATENDTVVLLKNVALTARVDTKFSGTIDLNGKTVSSTDSCANGSVFNVVSGNLTVKNGNMVGIAGPTGLAAPYENECDVITVRSGASVTTEDVSISINCRTGCCIYAFNGGHAYIKSGSYTNLAEDFDENGTTKAMLLNQADIAEQLIFVSGGTFKGENPANGDNGKKCTTFVAEGYIVTAGEGVWTVSKCDPHVDEDGNYVCDKCGANMFTKVYTAADLFPKVVASYSSGDARGNTTGGVYKLMNDISVWGAYMSKDMDIDLNGHTLTITYDNLQNYAGKSLNLKIKNGTINSDNSSFWNQPYGGVCTVEFGDNVTLNMKPTQTAFVLGQGSGYYLETYGVPELTVKNVKVSGSGYLLHASWYSGDQSKATFIDCETTITEAGTNPSYGPVWVSGGSLDATFTNCKLVNNIGAAMKVKDGNITLNNCTLEGSGKTAGVTSSATKYAIDLKGCTSATINGGSVKYTGGYTGSLVKPIYANEGTLTIGLGTKVNCGDTSVYTLGEGLAWSALPDENGFYTVVEK